MNYWIASDFHLGHSKMSEYCGRPEGFELKIFDSLSNMIKDPGDVFIHLGDICFKNDAEWHSKLMPHIVCKKWLVLGNHDSKSIGWYLSNGWDFVAESFSLNIFGYKILFTHEPHKDIGYTLNIHGHLHNTDHHDELKDILTHKHCLVSMEHLDYRPISLRTFIDNHLRINKNAEA